MGTKDIAEKTLMEHNDVFADIMNVLVYKGREVVNQYQLENAISRSQYKAETGRLHEQERDVCKYWKKGEMRLALYGIENQTEPDSRMPFRVIAYDGAGYRSQLLENEANIVPAATFVLYFGTEKQWKEKCSLKELVHVPEGLEEYVNDYKIHVFQIAWLTEEQLELFQSDFRIVARFFVEKRKNKDYKPDDRRVIRHVDEVLKLLSVMTGDSRYENILDDDNRKGKVNTMCDVAERLVKQGIEEGIQKGREEGIQKGREEGIQKGREEGIQQGEKIMASLVHKLLADGRTADMELALKDETIRKRLYGEYELLYFK